MTECTRDELLSKAPGRREYVARFDGGDITSDAGVLLLDAVEKRRRILRRLGDCFVDHRAPERVEHTPHELVAQRVLALALGYEDLNDHETLRFEPLLASIVGKKDPKGRRRKRTRDEGSALAAPSTLCRLENAHPGLAQADRYCRLALDFEAVDELLIDLFLEAHEGPPGEVILDLDATDARIHGDQQGRFFHGYYDKYCYLPLYIFAGDHLLAARLRRSNIDAAQGSLDELERIVGRIRAAWPETRILVRGDSGFCREWLMAWCEVEKVDFLLGLARNDRLRRRIRAALERVEDRHDVSGKAEREFVELRYRTLKSWTRKRRVVAKAEFLRRGENPRYVVTSLSKQEWDGRALYEDLYCARGEMENRIKEQQLDLFADRVSCHVMRGNQVRTYLSGFAYILLAELRRLALEGTELARAQCGTIRLKLLKIGAQIRVTARRIWISMSESYPWRAAFVAAWRRLVPT